MKELVMVTHTITCQSYSSQPSVVGVGWDAGKGYTIGQRKGIGVC